MRLLLLNLLEIGLGIPWQIIRQIGLIVGQVEQAEELIAEVDEKFTAAREAHPEFEGATGLVASTWGYPDNFYAYHSQDPRNRLLSMSASIRHPN